MMSNGGFVHSEACRSRIPLELMATPGGRVRLEAYEERVDRAINHDRSMEELVRPNPVAPRQWEHHGHVI